MNSIWEEIRMPRFPHQQQDQHTDVLIIGGGAVGLLCAYFLREKGIRCLVAERDRICGGVTGNTTAKITSQHGFIYQKLLEKFGAETARQYYCANQEAVAAYGRLCREIDCDFEVRDNVVYSVHDRAKAESEMQALHRIGAQASFSETVSVPVSVAGAVRFPDQAQFHPLKFFSAIARDLPVLEQTPIFSLDGTTAVTPYGKIRAKKIVVATHFPFLNTHGSYFLKLYQYRSYVLALQNAPMPDAMYVDEKSDGLSFRAYRDVLLLGGKGGRTGKPNGAWSALRRFAHTQYPGADECSFWATQDCMSLDGIPYIGQYSARTPNWFVATGFNKWGMTGAMVAATVLRDLLLGKQNPYAELYSPSRNILCRQLFLNGKEAVSDLLSLSPKRCPHLGCTLRWNGAEHSWDCPCHGSRFAADGKLLDNPANGDLNVK